MAEASESVEASSPEDESAESVTELLEQLGRQVSALVFYETRLAASRRAPQVRRATRDVAMAAATVVAFLTAFVLANAAAVQALSTVVSAWAAALLLAAAWTAVGAVLGLYLWARARRMTGWRVADAEKAREEAEQAVRETLERLSPVVSREIALAAIPTAGGVAGGVVDAGGELIEGADEIVDALTESVPGGSVVNQMWDVVLMPGRFGIRVATTVLRRNDSG